MTRPRLAAWPQLIALAILLGAFSPSSASTAAAVLSWGGRTRLGEEALADNQWRAVAIGGHHTLVLTPEGAVRAWGEDYYGQCDVPLEGGFTGIAAGLYHSLSLRRDGSIAVWGDNTRGQCRGVTARGFVVVGSGDWHCLAIQSDGSLVAWGWNEYGQCNVPPDDKYTAVCGGHGHSLALASDGTVVAWGNNADGQCNVPDGDDFTAVAAGAFHSLALRSDGSLAAWGCNDDGQCDVPAGGDFTGIAAGAFHSLALKNDGSVVAWGHNGYAQCDIPASIRLVSVTAGGYRSLGIPAEAAEPIPWEQCDYDVTPVFTALGRLADKVMDGLDEAVLLAAEADEERSLGFIALVETQVAAELILPAPEAFVLRDDDGAGQEAEPSTSLVLAEPLEDAIALYETVASVAEDDDSALIESPAPVFAQVAAELILAAPEAVAARDDEGTSQKGEAFSELALAAEPISLEQYDYDLRLVFTALGRFVGRVIDGLDEAVLLAAEADEESSLGSVVPAEVQVAAELPPAAPEVVVSSDDDAVSQEAEPSIALASAEPVQPVVSPDETTTPVAEVDPPASFGAPAPVAAPIASSMPTVAVTPASDRIVHLAAESMRKRGPGTPMEAETAVEEKVVASVGRARGGSLATHRPAAAPPRVDDRAGDLILVVSATKGPLLFAGCIGVGLAAVSCVFFLLRRAIRKLLVDRRQRQERQEDLFWSLLLRGDQPQPLSKN